MSDAGLERAPARLRLANRVDWVGFWLLTASLLVAFFKDDEPYMWAYQLALLAIICKGVAFSLTSRVLRDVLTHGREHRVWKGHEDA